MKKEEFKKYREKVLNDLTNYREGIEHNPDIILSKLQIFWNDFKAAYKKWREGEDYLSCPKDVFYFFPTVDTELSHIIDHLEETGEWRIPCAIRHFDDLLKMIRIK